MTDKQQIDEELREVLEDMAGPPHPARQGRRVGSQHRRKLVVGVLVAVSAIAVAGVFSRDHGTPGPVDNVKRTFSASCFNVIEYQGSIYRSGYNDFLGAAPEQSIGTGTSTACEDSPRETVDLTAVQGVSPDVAVATRGGEVFTRMGYFPISKTFPGRLSSAPVVREEQNCVGTEVPTQFRLKVSATTAAAVKGTVVDSNEGPFAPQAAVDALLIDSYTRLTGLDRAGAPYVGPGALIDVSGITCSNQDGGREIVASTIAAAPQ
jgi:hypothetical protein